MDPTAKPELTNPQVVDNVPPSQEPEIKPEWAEVDQNLINQSTNQPTTPVMHEIPKKKKPSIVLFILIPVLIALGAFGVLAYQDFFSHSSNQTITQSTYTSTPSATPTSSTDSANLSTIGPIQDFMKSNCRPGDPPAVSAPIVDVSELPFTINTENIKATIKRIICISIEDNTKPIKNGYIYIALDNNLDINIYDDQSRELGHGGYPFLGFFGQKIYDQGGVQMGAWFQAGDGPQLLGSTGIEIRGVKKFTTKEGKYIFVDYTAIAIPGSDPRLMAQLQPYSKDTGMDQPEIVYDQATEAKIIDSFFGKTPNPTTPEGFAMQNMRDVLSSLTLK